MIDKIDLNKQRLIHIREACGKITQYVGEMEKGIFLSDPQVQDAVMYQLIIIGEAVIHIDHDLLKKYPHPWFKIRALRNYAAHEYFNLKMWTIWEVVNKHISKLHTIVNTILENEF